MREVVSFGVLVSCVHPVAILRAVFCTICSLSMFVSDALGDHMVEAYSSTGLVMALYVATSSYPLIDSFDVLFII